MSYFIKTCLLVSTLAFLIPGVALADEEPRQLLVTFKNENASYQSAGFQPPYRARKRYAESADVRNDAKAIASEYSLVEVNRWPLKSLSVFCYVFQVTGENQKTLIAALSNDRRVETAQWLNTFRTESSETTSYDDTYLAMQHSVDTIALLPAHQYSRGEGVRVAVVDSDVDRRHEDFDHSLKRTSHLGDSKHKRDRLHGTAVSSIIGAVANNSRGIVGVAPGASLEVFEACWLDGESGQAVCDTFSLAKALDAMIESPPDVINLSLCGPDDALIERILLQLIDRGVVVVAAAANTKSPHRGFPANMKDVIAVASIGEQHHAAADQTVYAPGDRILVAVPSNDYEFMSGSSFATAHVSGIVALIKATSPEMGVDEIRRLMIRSQSRLDSDGTASIVAVNACRAMALAESTVSCE